MVKTPGLPNKPTAAVMAGLLLFATSAPSGAADPPLDFGDAPFVIFAPAPPLPDEISDYPLPDGAEDYWDLWDPDAPWAEAAEHIDAFATHAWILRYSSTDEDLRRMCTWLDEHDIPLGFEGPSDLEQAQRIKDLGGRVDFISLDEPFVNAYKKSGPGTCGYPVEQVVDEVADFVRQFRAIHRGVLVGSIEPILDQPYLTSEDFEVWLDTWAERTGEPFAFLSIDVDWRQADWPERVREAEAVADARDVPFGMLYLGSGFERRNDRWLEQMAQHAATLEQGAGVTPDIVGFYSWHSLPDRLLPDDDIEAYTGRINQYFGARTQLEVPSIEG